MRAGWRSASSRLFTRLAVAFGGALLVSFGLATVNSVLPLRQTIRQEAFDDLHETGIFSWEYLLRLGREFETRWPAYLEELAEKGMTRGRSNER